MSNAPAVPKLERVDELPPHGNTSGWLNRVKEMEEGVPYKVVTESLNGTKLTSARAALAVAANAQGYKLISRTRNGELYVQIQRRTV